MTCKMYAWSIFNVSQLCVLRLIINTNDTILIVVLAVETIAYFFLNFSSLQLLVRKYDFFLPPGLNAPVLPPPIVKDNPLQHW